MQAGWKISLTVDGELAEAVADSTGTLRDQRGSR